MADDGIGGILQAFTGAAQMTNELGFGIWDAYMGYQDFEAQQDQNALAEQWQRFSYFDTQQREDTAIQRRAQDLRAAGLNPILAAGGGANAGGQVSMPTRAGTHQNAQEGIRNLAKIDALKTVQMVMEGKLRLDQMKNQNKILEAQNDYINMQTRKGEQDINIKGYNQRLAEELGVRSDIAGGLVGQLQQLYHATEKGLSPAPVLDGLKSTLQSLGDYATNAMTDTGKAVIEEVQEVIKNPKSIMEKAGHGILKFIWDRTLPGVATNIYNKYKKSKEEKEK